MTHTGFPSRPQTPDGVEAFRAVECNHCDAVVSLNLDDIAVHVRILSPETKITRFRRRVAVTSKIAMIRNWQYSALVSTTNFRRLHLQERKYVTGWPPVYRVSPVLQFADRIA